MLTLFSCHGHISAAQSKESLESVTEQKPLVNREDLSPESPSSSQSQMSDEPAYDTGVSSSSSVNGDRVECVVENNVENKLVDEQESKKADIKKAKVIIIVVFIHISHKLCFF